MSYSEELDIATSQAKRDYSKSVAEVQELWRKARLPDDIMPTMSSRSVRRSLGGVIVNYMLVCVEDRVASCAMAFSGHAVHAFASKGTVGTIPLLSQLASHSYRVNDYVGKHRVLFKDIKSVIEEDWCGFLPSDTAWLVENGNGGELARGVSATPSVHVDNLTDM